MKTEFSIDFSKIKQPAPSLRRRLFRLIWRLCRRSRSIDMLLSPRLPELRHLEEVNPADCIPDFDHNEVVVRQCPIGVWSTPLIDVVVLLKCALGFHSKRILEIGSYLGHTAKMLAENVGPDTLITTLDEYPEHGSAYRGTPVENKIERRVGKVSLDCFKPGEKFDLIFIDADHRFESVVNDTEVALSLISENGFILWHDYQHEDSLHGQNGVPEALRIFSEYLPIIALQGTYLAISSRQPELAAHLMKQRSKRSLGQAKANPWQSQILRG